MNTDCAKISEDIVADMKSLSSDTLVWGQELAACKNKEALAKQHREFVAAELDAEARVTLGGDKKPTEATIAGWVKSHPDMQSAEAALIDASRNTDNARAMVDALHAKRDMLILLGGKS